jgi:hypothetical protein
VSETIALARGLVGSSVNGEQNGGSAVAGEGDGADESEEAE